MGCTSCSSGSGGSGGCSNNKRGANGSYGSNKLEVFDWLAGIPLPDNQKPFDIVEVRFKNNRKGFYRFGSELELYMGDIVTVEVTPGYDVGVVTLTGEIVRKQMKRKDAKDNYEIKKVLRKSTEAEIAKWQDARKAEKNVMMRARTIAQALQLQMKISDVEFQGDKSKATFYYTAEDRVDFRELIKKFAEEFRIKIEMRQIGYRYEAAKLGGIGSCGRELCCSSWLTDFRAVSTSAARYQQLSLNPAKLAGQCGKLKCCLNYELDQYVEAIREFPSVNTRLKLPKGDAVHFKTDIFKQVMYFIYENQPGEAPFPLHVGAIKEIIEQNKRGIVIEDLDDFIQEEPEIESTDFAQVVGQDSLTRFDKRKSQKGPKRKPHLKNDRRNRPDEKATPAMRQQAATENPAPATPNAQSPQKKNHQKHPSNKPADRNAPRELKPPHAGNKPHPKRNQPRNGNKSERKPNERGGNPSDNKPPKPNPTNE